MAARLDIAVRPTWSCRRATLTIAKGGCVQDVDIPTSQVAWAQAARETVTQALIVRSRRACGKQRLALERRAVLLSAPLVLDVVRGSSRPTGNDGQLVRVALSGLVRAVRSHDPESGEDFTGFAVTSIKQQSPTTGRTAGPETTEGNLSRGRPATHSRSQRVGRPLLPAEDRAQPALVRGPAAWFTTARGQTARH